MARKKSTKQVSETRKAYNKERGRIQRQISRMRKRGYMGMEDMLPPIPKKITKASVRRLKKITTKDLYDKADFVDLTTGEVLGTGQQGRAIERKQASQRAAQTRKRRARQRLQQQEQPEEQQDFSAEVQRAIEHERQKAEEEWQRRKAREDAEKRRQMQEQEYARQFGSGVLMEQKVRAILDAHRQEWPRTVADIESDIANAEGDEGHDEFWERLADNPEFTEDLEEVFYKAGDRIDPAAFNKVRTAIRNRPMSAQEARSAQDLYESDQYDAFDIDEEP